MYPIDLQTILRVLSRQSGELRADVKQIAGMKDVCQASVILSSGKVVSCVIYHAGKVVLSGETALRALDSKGILEWEYLPSASPAQPVSEQTPTRSQSVQERSPVPYERPFAVEKSIGPFMVPVQTQRISREEFASWPRPYRFVYQLSTGEKTVAEIAQILSLTSEQIRTVLFFLIRSNAITL